MRKLILLLFLFILTLPANAKGSFSNIDSINSFRCKGKFIDGTIDEHKNATYRYTVKDSKIYASNLEKMYSKKSKKPKKVLKLKIEDDYITFKERYVKFQAAYYMWFKIDKKTGKFTMNAKNDYGYFYKKANVEGKCVIEN